MKTARAAGSSPSGGEAEPPWWLTGTSSSAQTAQIGSYVCEYSSGTGEPGGTPGSRMPRIEPGSVAILDELCSGTNPDEGEAIFEMVVSLLPRLGPQVFVSTHFLGLAARLEKQRPVPSLSFLQVELDPAEKPTYQFVPGVATTSLAHKVAARLGVTKEELEKLVAAKLPS